MATPPWMYPISSDLGSLEGLGLVSTWMGIPGAVGLKKKIYKTQNYLWILLKYIGDKSWH